MLKDALPMPTFEIRKEAALVALSPAAVSAPLSALPDAARAALTAGHRRLRAGTTLMVRTVAADRALTKQLRDWFIHAEVILEQSADPRDRSHVESCRDAANALIVAFATGRDLPLQR
jgi:hypothetical protein